MTEFDFDPEDTRREERDPATKHGTDKSLEAQANEWLSRGTTKQKRSVARDVEKIKYEHGWITADECEHYDPTVDWKAIDAADQFAVDAEDIDYLDGTWDVEDNVVRASPELVERRQLRNRVQDDDIPLFGDEDWQPPKLGDYAVERKVCTRCKKAKRRDMFSVDSRKRDGLQSQCKQCHKEVTAQKRNNRR